LDGTQAVRPNALPVAALVGGGAIALAAGAVAGGDAAVAGAGAFFVAVLLSLGQTRTRLLTWPNALLVLIALLWLVPMKLYRLPVNLPFHLELYRVLILVLVLGFVVDSIRSKRQLEAYTASKPLFVLAATVLASQIVNSPAIDVPGNEWQSAKSLSLFLSFIIVFLLFASTLDSFREIEHIVAALVVGAVAVAAAAVYEGYTFYNVFNHLSEWIPGFVRNEREILELRAGRLRVHASAQHPIALGAALMMVLPFAVYLASRAKTQLKRGLWIACIPVLLAGAAATISRTTVAMGVGMIVVTLLVRRQALVRFAPLALVLPILVHVAAPGAMGGILKSFGEQEGTSFVNSFYTREGESGSGRLADLVPGLDLWARSPIIGLGIDNPEIATSGTELTGPTPGRAAAVPLIFDNEYLHTFVTLGLAGLIAMVWLVWGSVVRFVRGAKRIVGPHGDFVAACAIVCAGYGASMFFYDSLAYIQATLLLFITAALGLKTIALTNEEATASEPASSTT